MKITSALSFLIVVLASCIEPFDLHVQNQEVLVVDGLITDQPGPYFVKIYKTLPLTEQLDHAEVVQGAVVTIEDELGTTEALVEGPAGTYQTTTLQGVIGKTYQLRFTTKEGFVYESTPEKLLPVGDILNLYSEFEQKGSPASFDTYNPVNGFKILVDAQVLPEQQGLVRWRWTGTYEIRTYPELQVRTTTNRLGQTVITPNPPTCSGWFFVTATTIAPLSPCECCYCWVTQYASTPLISDERFISNNTVTGQQIAFVTANRRYLFEKYHLEVEQMSVSQEAYDFWKKVDSQQTTGSNLFQTPPPPTTGNITSISGGTQAVGIFSASAIKKQSLEVNRNEVPYEIPPIDTIAVSCRDAFRYSTSVRPPFW